MSELLRAIADKIDYANVQREVKKKAQADVDTNVVLAKLLQFDVAKYQDELQAAAQSHHMTIQWVTEPGSGWDGNVEIRKKDENELDAELRTATDVIADILVCTDKTPLIRAHIRTHEPVRGAQDQLLYYAFLEEDGQERKTPITPLSRKKYVLKQVLCEVGEEDEKRAPKKSKQQHGTKHFVEVELVCDNQTGPELVAIKERPELYVQAVRGARLVPGGDLHTVMLTVIEFTWKCANDCVYDVFLTIGENEPSHRGRFCTDLSMRHEIPCEAQWGKDRIVLRLDYDVAKFE
jgi:hypothetical protein